MAAFLHNKAADEFLDLFFPLHARSFLDYPQPVAKKQKINIDRP